MGVGGVDEVEDVVGHARSTVDGPNGGDELNILKAGANYGWPVTSRGTDRRLTFTAGDASMRPASRGAT